MHLLDSNIIIYSYLPGYEYLRQIFVNERIFASEISRVEVLGYHKLTNDEETYFKSVFDLIELVHPSKQVFDSAITIRKLYKLSLGDSLVASTALVNNLTVYTRNLRDFERIDGLKVINPIL